MTRFFTLFSGVGLLALPSFGWSQQLEDSFHRNVTTSQHGGVFHLATGTWTRQIPQALGLGPNVIYNNTANTGGFTSGGLASQTRSFHFVDAARVPTTSSPTPGVDRDAYNITGIELAYCVDDDATATGPLNLKVELFNLYGTCQDPALGLLIGEAMITGLPNFDPVTTPPGYFDCWTIELDLSGGQEICMLGDGEGSFLGVQNRDQFGIGVTFDPDGTGGYLGAIPVGPTLAGDRNWTANASGGILTPSGGGGTYYGPAETCVPTAGGPNSSGFDQEDSWWIGDRPGTGQAAGCYWFGGYSNPTGCAADGTTFGHVPNAGLYARMFADTSSDCTQVQPPRGLGTHFCFPSFPNSTGDRAAIEATTLNTGIGSGLHLEVTGGVPGEFGYFLIGTAQGDAPWVSVSDGRLCLSVQPNEALGRYNTGTTTNSVGRFGATGVLENLVGTATSTAGTGFDVPSQVPIPGTGPIVMGATWHFQLWYRDSAAGVGHSNFSHGVSVQF